MLIKRFFAFVISAFLITFPVYSYATTSVGGWTALDTITAGANNTINATKTAGGKVLKSAITIAPQAGKVGKYLLRGGAAGALALAVPQLIGEGVDWVLDPANNAIKYTVTESGSGAFPAGSWSPNQDLSPPFFGSVDSLCKYVFGSAGCDDSAIQGDTVAGCGGTGSSRYCTVIGYRPAGGGSPPVSVEKSIPIDTVASKVIANAEAGHAPSQEAVKATALEGFAAGEHDAALDAAAVPDTGVENPPDTENPPVDPAAPFDPSSIIAAINSLKAMLAGILSSMTGFFDWMKAPVPPDEEKKDVPFATTGDVGLDSVDRYEQRIDFSGQCPVNDFSFTMMGVTYAKPIPYHHFCGFLEQIAPWLLAMCYLGTAYFVVENI